MDSKALHAKLLNEVSSCSRPTTRLNSVFGWCVLQDGMSKNNAKVAAKAGMSYFEIRSLWIAAKRGDDGAKSKIFQMTLQDPSISGMLMTFAKHAKALRYQAGKPKQKAPLSGWEKAKSTLSKSGARVVSGGLPSLGKRR